MKAWNSMRLSFIGILLWIVSLSLTGCANYGTATYTVEPMLIDGHAVCCKVQVHNGKQYASLDALIQKTGDDYTVVLSERDVEAFGGQQIAAGAAKSLASTSAKAAAAVLVAPALLTGTVGAAAAGVGAGVLIDQAGQD